MFSLHIFIYKKYNKHSYKHFPKGVLSKLTCDYNSHPEFSELAKRFSDESFSPIPLWGGAQSSCSDDAVFGTKIPPHGRKM